METFQGQEAEGRIRRRQFTVWNYRADDGRKEAGAQLRVARHCLRLRAYACWCGFSGWVLMWR